MEIKRNSYQELSLKGLIDELKKRKMSDAEIDSILKEAINTTRTYEQVKQVLSDILKKR